MKFNFSTKETDICESALLLCKEKIGNISNLGGDFVFKLFNVIILNNRGFLLIVKQKKIIGFVLFSYNSNKIFKNLFKKFNFIFFFLIKNILDFKKIFYFILLFNVSIKLKNNIRCELLTIVIKKKYRGLRIGSKLINRAEAFLKQKKIKKYLVRVNNKRNIQFYLKNKFFLTKNDYKYFNFNLIKNL